MIEYLVGEWQFAKLSVIYALVLFMVGDNNPKDMMYSKYNRFILVLFLAILSCSIQAQTSWQVMAGINNSQQLVDRKGNNTNVIDDDFHPSFGGQLEVGIDYSAGKFRIGTGMAVIFMRFFADKNSWFNDTWIGEERKDGLWTHWIIELPINIEYVISDKLPSFDLGVLNSIIGQDPLNTFAGSKYPYSLGVGVGSKYMLNEDYFIRLGYRIYGLENYWKPDKGSYFYPSIWSMDMGYKF